MYPNAQAMLCAELRVVKAIVDHNLNIINHGS